jgi:hypothetical protein
LALQFLEDDREAPPFFFPREGGGVGGDGSAAAARSHPSLARAAFALAQRDARFASTLVVVYIFTTELTIAF